MRTFTPFGNPWPNYITLSHLVFEIKCFPSAPLLPHQSSSSAFSVVASGNVPEAGLISGCLIFPMCRNTHDAACYQRKHKDCWNTLSESIRFPDAKPKPRSPINSVSSALISALGPCLKSLKFPFSSGHFPRHSCTSQRT